MPADIEIFRAGRHTSASGETLSFSEADLAGTAAAYDPALHQAPLVIGHPRHDAPAYGWVNTIRRDGGSLFAEPDQVDPEFAELVRTGRFKKISASFYRPESPANPKPGTYYLRHVGFLGAQPPAVKGLKPVELADGDDAVTVEFGEISGFAIGDLFRSMRDWMLTKFGQEAADQALPAGLVTSIQEQAAQPSPPPAGAEPAYTEPTTRETDPVSDKTDTVDVAELARREKALQDREAAFAEREQKRRRDDNAAFLDGLVKDGRPLPCEKTTLLAFMDAIAGATVEFGEGEKRDPLTVFKDDVLGKLPKQVDFKEHAAADGADTELTDAEQISRAALVYQEEQRKAGFEISITQAVRHVTKETAR